jgi:predicted  nucleic acid-binding Zn-ribbon protein
MAAKKETLSVEDRLEALYKLQIIDSQIDKIQIIKGELPMEVQDLEDEVEGLNTRMAKIDEEIAEINSQIALRTGNKDEAKILITKYEKQQANVKNNREYDALSKEIELQKLEIELSDKKIKDLKVKIDVQKQIKDEAQKVLSAKIEDLNEKKKELNKIIEETDNELKSLEKESKKALVEVDDRLKTAYERIRAAYRNGLAVVTIERDSCGGCYAKIPPQKQMEIKQRKKIMVCEHCGRIYAYPKDKEISEAQAKEAQVAAPKTTRSRSKRAVKE